MMTKILNTSSLGFPRIGAKRELKFALEAFWNGNLTSLQLQQTASDIRKRHWLLQKQKGITYIPSNDFSFYDHVLDMALLVGAIPKAYQSLKKQTLQKQAGQRQDSLDDYFATYFAMARGNQSICDCANHHHKDLIDSAENTGLPALEMTKWFDTNYHYIVPELEENQEFALNSLKPVEEFLEAKALGILTRPVLLGPISFLLLSKCRHGDLNPLDLLPKLLPVYQDILRQLKLVGCSYVQIDEPCLVLDLNNNQQAAYNYCYKLLCDNKLYPDIMLASYFGDVGKNIDTLLGLPVKAYHIDLIRGCAQLPNFVKGLKPNQVLSLGIINGRNIWRCHLEEVLQDISPIIRELGADRVEIAPSCSLLHVPIDLELETKIDDDLKSWLSFASQKLDELFVLAKALGGQRHIVEKQIEAASVACLNRKNSPLLNRSDVRKKYQTLDNQSQKRANPYEERAKKQEAILNLPLFPTTTIGSFPQSSDIRKMRADFNKGQIDEISYDAFLIERTKQAIEWQEEVGLDVLVHGEFERNDMVQYFGEQLDGFAFSSHGWVQSYGSRYVRPPIIFGDVARPKPMSVKWWQIAQSFTKKPVKAMLTGSVTILNWSFVRNDQSREETAKQIALAIRDEVLDLEKAGAQIIQIDEAAIREGLPLKDEEKANYLAWAVDCFHICQSLVRDETQIHTHMCYSNFDDIMESIAYMDADVISIETSRSKMELLDSFKSFAYPNAIGPGVYDIHSPRIPTINEMVELLSLALQRLKPEQLWVNPDCGLKTRQWEEVRPAIKNMVEAAKKLRQK